MFGKRVKELRIEKNLSQSALAKALNIDRTTVMKWETEGRETSFEMLVKVADYFEVTTDYLLGRTDF